jgi:hypothetical protein
MGMQKCVLLTQGMQLDDGRSVKRIMAMRDFGNVRKGDIGGFVEWTNNLSQSGNCWIAGHAVAAGWSRISGNALLKDHALCDGHVLVYDRAVIGDDAVLKGRIAVSGDAGIGWFSYLRDGVTVRDRARIFCRNKVDCSELHIRGGEFIASEVDELMNTSDNVTAACREIIVQTRDWHSVLIFGASVDHATKIKETIERLTNGDAEVFSSSPLCSLHFLHAFVVSSGA